MTWKFLVELTIALVVSVAGGWLASRLSAKYNRQAQAEERIAAALERAYPAPTPSSDAMGFFRAERCGQ